MLTATPMLTCANDAAGTLNSSAVRIKIGKRRLTFIGIPLPSFLRFPGCHPQVSRTDWLLLSFSLWLPSSHRYL
jgi:hypothetical protein